MRTAHKLGLLAGVGASAFLAWGALRPQVRVLSGRVADYESGHGLAAVRVRLSSSASREYHTLTQPDGSFEIRARVHALGTWQATFDTATHLPTEVKSAYYVGPFQRKLPSVHVRLRRRVVAQRVNRSAWSDIGDRVQLHEHKEIRSGRTVDLSRELHASKRGVILLWYSPLCGKCIRYTPRFNELFRQYADEGWLFYAVFSGSSAGTAPDQLSDLSSHRRAYKEVGVAFPVLDDRAQSYPNHFGVTRTPTLAVVTRDGRLRYRGPPWDLATGTGYGVAWLKATTKGLPLPRYEAEELRRQGWG